MKQRRVDTNVLLDVIGAHAAVGGFGLINRDEGYRARFEVELLNPGLGEAMGAPCG